MKEEEMQSEGEGPQEELQPKKKRVHLGAKAKKALKILSRLAKRAMFQKAAVELQQGKFKSMWYVLIVA